MKKKSFSNFSWIQVSGKGNFLCSPAVKRTAEKEIEAGAKAIVIDLKECPTMDSTFMGMLAGLSKLMKTQSCEPLQITGLSENTRKSLVTLGIAPLMDLESANKTWAGKEEDIRSELNNADVSNEGVDKGQHVYESHKELIEAHQPNEKRFADVMKFLKPNLKK